MIKKRISKTRNKTMGKAHCIYLPSHINNRVMELSNSRHLSISLIVQHFLMAGLNNDAILDELVKMSE